MDEPVIDTSTPESLERDFMAWLNVSEFHIILFFIKDFVHAARLIPTCFHFQSDPTNTPIRKSVYHSSDSIAPALISQFTDAFEVSPALFF